MKRLLIAGAGHAHVHVLRAFAATPPPDAEITLVTPFPRQIYSGMLPGWIAGHYPVADCAINLAPIVRGSSIKVRIAHVARLDLEARIAYTELAEPIPFDLLSLDIGSAADESLPGSFEHGLSIRPIERFIAEWPRVYGQLQAHSRDGGSAPTLTVVGGGAGGLELALAMAHRARGENLPLFIQLVAGKAGVLPGFPAAARERALRWLPPYRVRLIEDDAVELGRGTVLLADGGEIGSDATVVATGAAPAGWLRESGLATDDAGYVSVDACLRSVSHPFVFAAGDCASMQSEPRPKSGVYAVRAGAPLGENLRRALAERPLKHWTPQRHALYLLSLGARRALGVRGGLTVEGGWVWTWKDRIDRRFMRMYGATPTATR